MIYNYEDQQLSEMTQIRAALVRAAAHVTHPTIAASVYVTVSSDWSLSITLADTDFPDVTIEKVPVVLWRELVDTGQEPSSVVVEGGPEAAPAPTVDARVEQGMSFPAPTGERASPGIEWPSGGSS